MDNSPYVRSVLKALHILDIFGFDDPLGEGFSRSELARRTGIAPNTLCKLLKTLVRAEYLTQDSRHRYHSSHRTCMIQMVTATHADLPDQIQQLIRTKSRHLAVPIYFTTLSFGERKMVLQTSDGGLPVSTPKAMISSTQNQPGAFSSVMPIPVSSTIFWGAGDYLRIAGTVSMTCPNWSRPGKRSASRAVA